MAQDSEQNPLSDNAPDPQYPYGAVPQSSQTETPLSYLSPEFYTAQNSASVAQQPESSGYTIPTPVAYTPPLPPSPTDIPPPSGMQSTQQYGAASNYGYGRPQSYYAPPGFISPPPQATPLPIGEALRQLPSQYRRVLTRPSALTFSTEVGKANWNIIWLQIVLYTVIVTIVGFLSNALFPLTTNALTPGGSITPDTIAIVQKSVGFLTFLTSYGEVFLIPFSLFTGTGILFLLSKAFGGGGSFLPQLYCTLLFLVPLGIIVNILSLLLAFLPPFGSALVLLIGLGNLVYQSVLLGFVQMAVHRLSGGRAAGAVLSLFGVALVLGFVLTIVLSIVLAIAVQPH